MIILTEKLIVVLMKKKKKKDMAKIMTVYPETAEFRRGGLYQNRRLILIQLSFTFSSTEGLEQLEIEKL